MATLKQSTAYNRMVLLVGTADHLTGLAGATLTITASKNGGAFASISPTVTDLGSGWYNLALTTTHTNTLGDLALHITATSADPTDFVDQVTANILGDTLPASLSGTQTFNMTGSITGNLSGSVGSVTAGVTVTTNSDKTGYALTSGERNSIADAMLDRDMSTGADSGSTTVRTVRQALRFLRNKWAIAAGTLTVYKEDDATSSWTSTVSTDAAAVPIVGTDPAGP